MNLTPEEITQGTSIGEVDRLLRGTDPILVAPPTACSDSRSWRSRRRAAGSYRSSTTKGRLIGLVPVRLLVNDIFLKIVPEEFLGAIGDVEGALEYAQHIRARVAADIMLPPTSVPLTATVRDAFETMHKARLNGLPILDEDGRVVSYLDQLELLLVWVRATGRSVLLRPAETDAPEGTT